jgi:two-component system LytT family sensor kinase
MPAPRRAPWLLAIGFWTFIAFMGSMQTYLNLYTHGHSYFKLLLHSLLVWSVWLAFSPLIAWAARVLPLVPFHRRNTLLHLLLALLLACVHIVLWMVFEMLLRPFDDMGLHHLSLDVFISFLFNRLSFELLLYGGFLGMTYALNLYLRAGELETSLSRARLHALELQLQPHFLFNTLHAIASLVRVSRNGEAVEMIAGLSDLLRYTLDHEGSMEVPLERELAMLSRYLEIQRKRFPDRLTVRMEVADGVGRAAVPPLILQPLAENAIRHGVDRSAAASVLEVRATRQGDMLAIELFNSGTFADGAPRGIGLTNTAERLRQMYGQRQTLDVGPRDGGVVARVTLPFREVPA